MRGYLMESPHESEPTPDVEYVNQEEPDHSIPTPPVPVKVCGPVATQRLPARTSSMRNIPLDAVESIAGQDDRRARVLVFATTGTAAFFIGTDRAQVELGASARFNSGQQVELFMTDRLYARSATPGTVCQLSVILENWAD